MGQSERLKAIVLRRTNYAEADRVLQLLTPKGRRSVIAKGVRRERSKLAGGIELLAICDVVIRSGRGDLGLLTSARLAEQGDLSADAIKLLRLIQAKPLATVAQIGGITEVISACWLVARQHAAV